MRIASALLALAFLLVVMGAGCGQRRSSASGAPPPSITSSSKPDSPRLSDPVWRLAADGDPLQLAALADHEGARGLLEGVEDGGEVCRTALSALPYADDAEIAYRRLGEIAAQASSAEVTYVLDALLRIASRPKRDTEVLDREGVRACAAVLTEIANRGGDSKRTKATAISILRMLADHREVDPKLVRADLDAIAK